MESKEEVGNVQVHISNKAIYTAVRNVMANEFKIDQDEIKNTCRHKMETIINKEVIEYLGKTGWGYSSLDERVKRALETKLYQVDEIVKKVVKELVEQKIREEIEGVVGAIVRNGLEINMGWRKERVKITMEEKK